VLIEIAEEKKKRLAATLEIQIAEGLNNYCPKLLILF
jgi:hypothetical protein